MCCRCNRTGLCKGCACVKADRVCSDCLPKRLGHCENPVLDQRSKLSNCPELDVGADHDKSISDSECPLQLDPDSASHSHSSSVLFSEQPLPLRSTISLPAVSWDDLSASEFSDVNQSHSGSFNSAELLLPSYSTVSPPAFTWGELDACEFSDALNKAYTTTVHWRANCFIPPNNRVGKRFVSELANMYLSFGTASALESVALKATIVLPHLLLQNPHKKSKTRDHTACLERRLDMWKCGDLQSLLDEGTAIQQRLPPLHARDGQDTARSFAKLMFTGKCKAALDLLNNSEKNAILHLDDLVDPSDPQS